MRAILFLSLCLLVAVNQVSAQFNCYKNSTGRGVGVPISTCAPGLQEDAGLCYEPCEVNYTGVGPVCWQNCPPGYTDTGAFCQPNTAWGDNSNCPWYDKCGLIEAKGCVTCPEGMSANGCICTTTGASLFAKNTYGRGVGVPLVCQPDQVYDAGLCYPPCESNQNGVGPVCWSVCDGLTAYSCGAICTANQTICVGTLESLAETLYQLTTQLIECGLGICGCNKQELQADIQQLIQILDIEKCNHPTSTQMKQSSARIQKLLHQARP